MTDKELMDKLVKLLTEWEYAYYALDNPIVSDAEYDHNLQKLIELEKKYPEWKDKNSPTSRVGGIVLNKFQKIAHEYSMLSLNNAFDEGDILHFDKQINEFIKKDVNEYVVEPKIDGLSISLIYENNELKQALTRGDGINGEDVTENVRSIKTIPLKIKTPFKKITIRGEVFISKDNFEKINSTLPDNKKFANPRNLAAGSLRNLDSKVTAKRNLDAYLYYVPNAQELGFKSHWETIENLKQWGFKVAPQVKLVKNINEAWKEILNFQKIRSDLSYSIDGVVLKLNDINTYELLGNTSKFPRWAIAYKFPANKVLTQLIDITTSVGRTGRINYVANLKKVNVDGSFISNATLHNYEYIKEKDIRINDYVYIYKAGDVIPKVLDVAFEKRDSKVYEFSKINVCPECKEKLEQINGEVDQYCINLLCPARTLQGIIHYCTRDAMNIENVSEKIIELLYRHRFIENILDLYSLNEKRDTIIAGSFKIKTKKMNNILDSIEKSKNRNLSNLIFGLGIRHVGYTTAKVLAKKYNTMDNLMNATFDELCIIKDIGPIVAKSIVDWFAMTSNQELIKNLKKLNVNMIENTISNFLVDSSSPYYDKSFLITGSFSISRNIIKEIMSQKFNAKFKSSISKNIDYILAGSNPTNSKINLAKELNIPIIYDEIWN
ncbi:NAD-dependent DNA ligase LigA [Mycoplasmoides pirum]|uniref:NAD-dependent DNA ligase LigA n=1 Tax=Mycoplasmoides pirum TaxID=2122 RepID=UPI0004890749|nr:NAD-dependent DNA ligase LigA [Mycoplasmoides pirum]